MSRAIAQNRGLILLSAALAVVGGACIVAALDTETRGRQRVQQIIEANRLDLWQQEQLIATTRELANQRYLNGCMVSRQQLHEGMAFPGVPDREPVCDLVGITGVVINGVLVGIARTDDQSIILGRTAGL